MIPVSFITSIMNNMPQLSNASIELKPGQIFQGSILKLLPDNQALVQLGGIKILAQLEANLQAGEKAWLQVQSSQNPVTLKVLTAAEQGSGRTKLVGENLADLAKAMGMDDAPAHQQLLGKLLQERLSVDKKTMQAAQHVLTEQGGDPEVADSALFAIKKGLPVTRESILGLRTLLFGSGTLNLAKELTGELAAFVAKADPGQASDEAVKASSHPTPSTQPTDGQGQRNPGHSGIPTNMVQASDELPALLEKAQKVIDKLSEMQQQAGASRLNGETVKDLLKGMGLMWENAIADGVDLSAGKDGLKPLLLQLKEGMQGMPHLAKAAELTDKFIQHITGQQLLAAPSDSPLQQYIFHIPFLPSGSSSFVQIEAKKKGKGEIDSDNCRLLFYLNLSHLGDVVVDVSIFNRIVGVEIHGKHPDLQPISHSFKDDLLEALKENGYTLSSLKAAKKAASAQTHASQPFSKGLAAPYKGVDIRI